MVLQIQTELRILATVVSGGWRQRDPGPYGGGSSAKCMCFRRQRRLYKIPTSHHNQSISRLTILLRNKLNILKRRVNNIHCKYICQKEKYAAVVDRVVLRLDGTRTERSQHTFRCPRFQRRSHNRDATERQGWG